MSEAEKVLLHKYPAAPPRQLPAIPFTATSRDATMRLLNVQTRQLKEFFDDSIPNYAILSHTWGEDEVTFQNIHKPEAKHKAGYLKIDYTCREALKDKIEWAWIDTCCIDKASSSELSEAINSMYRWYAQARICYAYLVDVDASCPELDENGQIFPTSERKRWHAMFLQSRWFTRGWTLQELLAPRQLHFFNRGWGYLGSKESLRRLISRKTMIGCAVLCDIRTPQTASVAQRMSWVSNRTTSRVEDMAYCLLGIFGINMPLLYGEGQRSFIRLQEEIIKNSVDQSIFAWDYPNELDMIPSIISLLAPHPKYFSKAHRIVKAGAEKPSESFPISKNTLQIRVHVEPIGKGSGFLAVLGCRDEDDFEDLLAVPIFKHEGHYIPSNVGGRHLQRVDRDKLTGQRETILITRIYPLLANAQYYEASRSSPRLSVAIRLSSNLNRMPDFEVVDTQPSILWSPSGSLMRDDIIYGSYTFAAILLRDADGTSFAVVLYFGQALDELRGGALIKPWSQKDANLWQRGLLVKDKMVEWVQRKGILGDVYHNLGDLDLKDFSTECQLQLSSGRKVFVRVEPTNIVTWEEPTVLVYICSGSDRPYAPPIGPVKDGESATPL